MSTALEAIGSREVLITAEQTALIKQTICADATDAEMQLFFYDCQRRAVHPLDRLIHFTKRGNPKRYTPITSIDFMRQRASATGMFAGEDEPVYTFLPSGAVDTCCYAVYRLVQGQRCKWTATARWDEYYPGDQLGFMWKKMPYVMLTKCAEALALRKAFPAELQGLYAKEEMDQAGQEHRPHMKLPEKSPAITPTVAGIMQDMGGPEQVELSAPTEQPGPFRQALEGVAKLAAEDPAAPYRRKINTADDEKVCQEAYNATPDHLKQDVHSDYFDTLKSLSKKKK
jgi:phage recombination protein Bet